MWSFRHLKHQNLSTSDDFIHGSRILFLVLFLATKEVVAPLANDPIMSGRLIKSVRHLEHQNPSSNSRDDFASSIFGYQRGIGTSCKRSSYVGEINTAI